MHDIFRDPHKFSDYQSFCGAGWSDQKLYPWLEKVEDPVSYKGFV